MRKFWDKTRNWHHPSRNQSLRADSLHPPPALARSVAQWLGVRMGMKKAYCSLIPTEFCDDATCSDSADHAIGHFQSDLPHDVEQIDAIVKPYRAELAEIAGEDEYCEDG